MPAPRRTCVLHPKPLPARSPTAGTPSRTAVLVIGADDRPILDTDALVSAIRRCAGVSTVATPLVDRLHLDDDSHDGGDALEGTHEAAGPMQGGDATQEPVAIAYDEDTVAVSIVALYGVPLARVVDQIETAVRPLIGHRALQVTITDLDTRGEHPRT